MKSLNPNAKSLIGSLSINQVVSLEKRGSEILTDRQSLFTFSSGPSVKSLMMTEEMQINKNNTSTDRAIDPADVWASCKEFKI